VLEKKGELRLGRFGKRTLPEGLIQSGEIKDKEKLAEFIRTNFQGMQGSFVVLSLPEEKAYVSLATLPKLAGSDIKETLNLQLEEYIPLSSAQAVFDYEVVSGEGEDHSDVIVVALGRRLVEDYLEVIKAGGLFPLVFEMEAEALQRAVLPREAPGTSMIIDFGRTRTSFIIAHEGVVRFTSTVGVAGEGLDRAIGHALKIEAAEAERIKKERGLVRTEKNEAVFNAILPTVSAIKDEVQRHRAYWNNHAEHLHGGKGTIERLYLAGGDSNLAGFSDYLSYELKIPTRLASPWVNITDFEHYVPEIAASESLSYATAIGLALRSRYIT
ncbi:MAG: pilus assembly protein PilM, partial [Patescibacteria group bacterium]